MTCACPTIVWRTTYSPAGKSTVPTLTGAVGIHEMSRVTFVNAAGSSHGNRAQRYDDQANA